MKLDWHRAEHLKAIREQFEKITASPEFARSERSCRLLEFLIERAQNGDGQHLKEYVVGVEGFSKSVDFDTRSSSIVRVGATRLRRKLRTYYQAAGVGDPLLITLPRGSYNLALELREDRTEAPESGIYAAASRNAATVAILPPVCSGVTPEEARLLVAAIWRSLHLAGGFEMLPPPPIRSRPPTRRRKRLHTTARYTLEIFVRWDNDRARVTASLRSSSHETIWRTEGLSIADLTLSGCVIALGILRATQGARPASRWYEMGRHVLPHLTLSSLWNSRICFEQAVLLHPKNPCFRSALALSCALLYISDAGSTDWLVARIKECTAGMSEPLSCVALALIAWAHDRDWNEAIRLLDRAREQSPEEPIIRYIRCLCLASAGKHADAAAELRQAHCPKTFSVGDELALGCSYWLEADYVKAAATLRCALAAEPANPLAHLLLGWVLLAGAHPAAAIEPLQTAFKLLGPGSPAIGALGFATARAGRAGTARDMLEDLRDGVDERYQFATEAAIIHLALGNEEEAESHVQDALRRRSGRLVLFNFTPEFDSVRSRWFPSLAVVSRAS